MKRTKTRLDLEFQFAREHARDQVIQKIRSLENDLKNKGATTSVSLDLLIQMLEYWFSQDEETINDPSYYREAK